MSKTYKLVLQLTFGSFALLFAVISEAEDYIKLNYTLASNNMAERSIMDVSTQPLSELLIDLEVSPFFNQNGPLLPTVKEIEKQHFQGQDIALQLNTSDLSIDKNNASLAILVGSSLPAALNMTMSPINNRLGVELRGFTQHGKLVALQIPKLKTDAQLIPYSLVYEGVIVFKGALSPCKTANCGIPN